MDLTEAGPVRTVDLRSAPQVRRDIRLVLRVTSGGLLGVDELIVDRDLEHPTRAGDEANLVLLAEFFEDLLDRAHGTGGVVSSTAELNGHSGHGSRLGNAWRGAVMRPRSTCTTQPIAGRECVLVSAQRPGGSSQVDLRKP